MHTFVSFQILNEKTKRPIEMSSKKPVSTFRNVFNVKKNPRSTIDPRFNPAMGEYKPELFRKNYSFVNDMRKNELKVSVIYLFRNNFFLINLLIYI